jgi:hypothetical protein
LTISPFENSGPDVALITSTGASRSAQAMNSTTSGLFSFVHEIINKNGNTAIRDL